MKIIRLNDNHIKIIVEENQKIFEDALSWRDKGTLIEVICELKGYALENEK